MHLFLVLVHTDLIMRNLVMIWWRVLSVVSWASLVLLWVQLAELAYKFLFTFSRKTFRPGGFDQNTINFMQGCKVVECCIRSVVMFYFLLTGWAASSGGGVDHRYHVWNVCQSCNLCCPLRKALNESWETNTLLTTANSGLSPRLQYLLFTFFHSILKNIFLMVSLADTGK